MQIQKDKIEQLFASTPFVMGLAYKQYRCMVTHELQQQFHITIEMYGALRVLDAMGQISQQTLADTLLRERSVTKRLVDNCIKRGIVFAAKSAQNRKTKLLAMTEEGLAVLKQANVLMADITGHYFGGLSEEENKLLLGLCRKLVREDILVHE
ncbi:hypothetical protein NFHSH190041_27440 [Shewanella sp. NFH-SH190041]|uniref:MarR family winged helix-turn-helix transcriptional regulator n=1 Tax=Shewanella sp. NFH-SH190041 TaxID=2950245 RepID=UPI0021C2A144|nr:MarR family transcriptional regulator [Shewanella sp. NFH-SH190041]BDM65292.1 hypothetical protein NFHSH190041_27440 [Shewanella sp. NFH-SH190041]